MAQTDAMKEIACYQLGIQHKTVMKSICYAEYVSCMWVDKKQNFLHRICVSSVRFKFKSSRYRIRSNFLGTSVISLGNVA
jgi:hypothetical protein